MFKISFAKLGKVKLLCNMRTNKSVNRDLFYSTPDFQFR